MQPQYMHPLEMAVAYVIIGIATAWYLGRPRNKLNATGLGSEFRMAMGFKIFASIFFLVPVGLIFCIPSAAHPVGFAAIILPIAALCLAGLVGVFTTKLVITTSGFRFSCLGFHSEYSLDAFCAVSTFRYSMVLERKDGGASVHIPVFLSGAWDLYGYFRSKIGPEEATGSKSPAKTISEPQRPEMPPVV